MDGWIRQYRKVLDNPIICKDAEYFTVWHYLLLNATHKPIDSVFNGKKITLQAGQLITGREKIADKFKINESKVHRILKTFEIEQQIEQQTSTRNRLITIVNWNEYQASEQQIEQQMNNKRTTNEQQMNTNKNIRIKEYKNNVVDVINNNINIIKCYEENVGTFTPAIAEILISYLDQLPEDMIIQAIKIATYRGKTSTDYIQGILNSWISKGYKSIEQTKTEKNIKADKLFEFEKIAVEQFNEFDWYDN